MKTLIQLFCAWFKMGLFTFGGGYAMLPMIQKEVIEKYHWATEDEVMDYYAIGQCTPGVIAVNTATLRHLVLLHHQSLLFQLLPLSLQTSRIFQ